ncbi:MAG: hypothetical protein IKN43_04675 [Selenomonadaceae bacterium]|nr:hypothetical protein [Selenomonadaceae bacterium]
MTENAFIKMLQDDVLDTESPISLDMALDDIEEWDSLSFVSFIAATRAVGKKVTRDMTAAAKTVDDLFCLVK